VVYRPAMAERRLSGRKSYTGLLFKTLAKPREAGKPEAYLLFPALSDEAGMHQPLPPTQASVST
tara:strand:+ start:1949 stop:2140 length:192 start_codon:yes stop_codon:yes gene_type:complete